MEVTLFARGVVYWATGREWSAGTGDSMLGRAGQNRRVSLTSESRRSLGLGKSLCAPLCGTAWWGPGLRKGGE